MDPYRTYLERYLRATDRDPRPLTREEFANVTRHWRRLYDRARADGNRARREELERLLCEHGVG